MSEKGTSADQQILAQQQALQAKLKKSVWLGAAIVALLLVLYIANQALQNDQMSDGSGTSSDVTPGEVTLSNIELEGYRDKFKEDLAEFESNYQSILENQDIINWQPKRVAGLVAVKDRALGEFARSSFQTASNTLSALTPDVQQLEQDWRGAYRQKLEESVAFLAQEKINQARFAFSKAIEIMPSNPDGRELQVKLDGYEEILNARQAYRIAQVENNLPRQIALLETLVSLDPSLTDEQNELNKLKRERVAQQHASLVRQGNTALDNNQVGKARNLLSQARALRPNDPATASLASRINSQSDQSTLQQRLNEVETLAQQQRWQAVLQKSSQYSSKHPGQERFSELQMQATQIVQAQQRVQQFLSRPERISDEGIRNAAVTTLQQSLSLSAMSTELASQLGKLASAIDKYSTALPVTINSDNESYILVLGIGHVGVVTQKQIELKPGDYTLEARREGYKTKRLQISVSANSDNSFFVASNEKI